MSSLLLKRSNSAILLSSPLLAFLSPPFDVAYNRAANMPGQHRCYRSFGKADTQHLYGETVSWSLAIASTAQLAIGRGSTPLGDTSFYTSQDKEVVNPFLLVLLCAASYMNRLLNAAGHRAFRLRAFDQTTALEPLGTRNRRRARDWSRRRIPSPTIHSSQAHV
jgi:hypothetical protein